MCGGAGAGVSAERVCAGRGGGHAGEEPGDARPHGPVLPPAPAQRHPAQRTALPRVSGVCVCVCVCVYDVCVGGWDVDMLLAIVGVDVGVCNKIQD